MQTVYDELIRRWRELALLSSCESLLGWDELTYMPKAGIELRSRQQALLAGLQHERATDPRLGELMDRLADSNLVTDPLSPAAVNLREARRNYQRLTKLPRALVEDLARTATLAEEAWESARDQADFTIFRPWLANLLSLKRMEAACLNPQAEPYDPLLQEYEPGVSAQELACLFDVLRSELAPFLTMLRSAPQQPDDSILQRPYSIEKQRLFCELTAETLGFDFERGRLDTAIHPFSISIGPGDCRITTRYHHHDFGAAFFATLHEVGHGLYEQGFAPEHAGTPMGEAPSVGVHESQARLWENRVGRSRAFWDYFYPLAKRVFRESLHDISADRFFLAINGVRSSVNRIRADEVTYDLHIMIRFEIERALLADNLSVADLPEAWAEAYQRYLGVTPKNDLEGCLQDGHWASGLFGYFPTYTLGNLYAAQLIDCASQEIGDLDRDWGRGQFRALLDWLHNKIHRQGSRYPANRLIESVTGTVPEPQQLVRYLQRKYGELYRL